MKPRIVLRAFSFCSSHIIYIIYIFRSSRLNILDTQNKTLYNCHIAIFISNNNSREETKMKRVKKLVLAALMVAMMAIAMVG